MPFFLGILKDAIQNTLLFITFMHFFHLVISRIFQKHSSTKITGDTMNVAELRFKAHVSNIMKEVRGQKESEFWIKVYDFLRKSNKGNAVINMELEAKFLLAALIMHGSSDAIRIAQIIHRYTLLLYHASRRNDPVFASNSADIPFLDMKVLLASGSLQHLIYYRDSIKAFDSIDLAVESTDEEFIICLIKHQRYSRFRIEDNELRSLISSFHRTW